MTALAEDPRGLKRICPNCALHYYDLNKRPITCPSCSTEFTGDVKVKSRRSRTTTEDAPKKSQIANDETSLDEDDDLSDGNEENEDLVSLDDVDEDDDSSVDNDDDDTLDIDDDDLDDLDDDDDLGAGLDDLDDDDDDLEVDIDNDDDDR